MLVKGRLADLGHGRAGPAGLLGQPVANLVAQLADNAGGERSCASATAFGSAPAAWVPTVARI